MNELLFALRRALRLCPSCGGNGEYEFLPHLTPSEISEKLSLGEELPKPETKRCLTCKKEMDILRKHEAR